MTVRPAKSYPITFVLLCVPVLLLTGCNGEKFETASGTVTVANTNVDLGLITWLPLEGNLGKKVCVEIKDGKYAIPEDRGLVPGNYRVEIEGIPGPIRGIIESRNGENDRAAMDAAARSYAEPYRPFDSKFNIDSELEREIKADGENIFDFEVTYAKAAY